jgi:hypothetical protein
MSRPFVDKGSIDAARFAPSDEAAEARELRTSPIAK